MNVLALFILSLVSITLYAEENKIEALYKLKNINGSILIESGDGKVKHHYNVNDNERFIPASTFKILNTLIILEEGLIQDQSETIQWDGQEREYAPWNKDQTLKSAFQYSCVWCYQHFAKQVGDQKYRQYLQIFDYGNHLTGSDVTRFWLDGELRTSVNDQISFLRKVYAERLPVKKAHIKTLKSIMLSEEHNSYKVWSKTGWSGKDGWFVGYLVVNKQVWYFANHIEINQNSDLKFRKSLTMEALKVLGIIPPKH